MSTASMELLSVDKYPYDESEAAQVVSQGSQR